LVVDEAHHLEGEATDQVGYALSRPQGLELINRALHEAEPIGLTGAIGMAFRSIAGARGDRPRSAAQRIQELTPGAQTAAQACRTGLESLFASLAEVVTKQDSNSGGYERQLRLTGSARRDAGWTQMEIEWDDLLQSFGKLIEVVRSVGREIGALSDDDVSTRSELTTEFELLEREIDEYRTRMTECVSQPESESIYWIAVHATSETGFE
jgi:DNA polymerase-3 subunit epsilon/ATP-dependent DNA helicase DinG